MLELCKDLSSLSGPWVSASMWDERSLHTISELPVLPEESCFLDLQSVLICRVILTECPSLINYCCKIFKNFFHWKYLNVFSMSAK